MTVVADSGPLHYLVLLGQAELLPKFYRNVLIPPAVAHELSAAGTPPQVTDWLAHAPDWLRIEPVGPDSVQAVPEELDLGEREAIALAQVLRADLLLMDDLAARAEARRRNLRCAGTLGVLRAAAEKDFIDVPTVLDRLQATNFYCDEKLIHAVFGKWLTRGK